MKKLIASSIVAGGTVITLQHTEDIINYARTVATEHEVSEISKRVLEELITEKKGPAIDQFADFIHSNMEAIEGRDTAVDHWGTPYELRYGKKQFTVYSAGADMTWGTGDDISATKSTQ